MSKKLFYKVARLSVKNATIPFPVNDPVARIIETIITDAQAQFILDVFKTSWISKEEISKIIGWDIEKVDQMLEELMHIGIVVGLPHPRTGVMHYRVVAFFPGLLEFTLMRGEKGPKQKKMAQLWEEIFQGLSKGTQANFEKNVAMFKNFKVATDRIVPVEQEIDSGQDKVIPLEEIKQLIDNEEIIGKAVCYCRHRKDLIDEPCQKTDVRENCFVLGRTAQFCIENDFAKPVSKEEVLEALSQAEKDGLVHKAFHTNLNPNADLDGICSCCTCCCGTFTNYYNGAVPAMSYSSYLAQINEEDCIGCGTCVEICPMEAIDLEDAVAVLHEEKCLGCGLCAYHCPESAIHLDRTGERLVFVPPPKVAE